ncbi:MAG: gamma-glutamyltransferase, partial [Phycisphaerales bacterium JB059]
MHPTLRLILLLALAACLPACAHHRGGVVPAPEAHATFVREAVAADHPLASQAGAEILAQGGNAVDAAVATSFALSVVRPYSCGIGGGGFMVIHLAPRDAAPATQVALNYRETSPAGVAPTHFESLDDPSASMFGGHSVATPGTILGLLGALDRYGTLDRETVLAPAI